MKAFLHYLTLSMIGLTIVLLPSCGTSSATGGAGFTDAYFDAAKLNAIMADPSCTKIRFYNVRRTATDTKGSVMMIGIKSDGVEIYDEATFKYRTYDKMSGATSTTLDLLKPAASGACRFIKDAGFSSYCAEFTKSSISGMLTGAGCNAIKLAPATTSEGLLTMKMWPAKINSGAGSTLPSPLPSVCTEPCPTYCGPSANYVNS